MADYFASQLGAGLADGTSPDNAWSVAGISWPTIGSTGNTLYLLDLITSKVQPNVNAQGTAKDNRTKFRGDYSGRECTLTITDNWSFTTGGIDYLEISGFSFVSNENESFAALYLTNTTGCYAHDNNFTGNGVAIRLSNAVDNIVIDNDIVPNQSGSTVRSIYLPSSGPSTGNLIEHNTINGFGTSGASTYTGGILVGTGSNGNTIRRNFVNHVKGDGILIAQADSNIIHSNIITQTGDGIALEGSNSNTVCNNLVHITEIYEATNSYPAMKMGDNFGAGLPADNNIIRNNIFMRSSVTGVNSVYGQGTSPIGASNTINNNLYWNPNTPSNIIMWLYITAGSPSLLTFAQFQAAGYELLGLAKDPKTNSFGIPKPGSPCYRRGKFISFSYADYKGHRYSVPPTIGAYEFTSGMPPALPRYPGLITEPFRLTVGSLATLRGYIGAGFGSISPSNLLVREVIRLAGTAAGSAVSLRFDGVKYPRVDTFRVAIGGFTVDLTWEGTGYVGSSTDISTYLTNNVGNTVDATITEVAPHAFSARSAAVTGRDRR